MEADVAVDSLTTVQDLLATLWDDVADLTTRERFAFELAVMEIAGNIVEHTLAADGAPGRRFTLELVADDTRLLATFEDNGQPAELDLSAVTMADVDDENGRGLALALASVDRVEYIRRDGHNVWELECRRE
jgi:serine/threonine-protein kinase RsbW